MEQLNNLTVSLNFKNSSKIIKRCGRCVKAKPQGILNEETIATCESPLNLGY